MILDTPALAALRAEVRSWAEVNAPRDWQPFLRHASDDEFHDFMTGCAAKLREGGYLTAHWPKEFGRRAMSVAQQIVLQQELVRADFPPPHMYVIALGHAAATLMRHGTPEQQRHISAIEKGEVWCQGFSEPDAGSDLASLQTRAVRQGDLYVVNGQKTWSSMAQFADWCLLLARTDPSAPKHRGISFFMLDMSSPGVEVRPIRQATGTSEFCEIFLTDVHILAELRIGAENDGWRIAQTTLSTERASQAIELAARLRRALDALCAEARTTPVAPDRTAAQDPSIRQELAARAAEVEAFSLLAEQVVGGLVRHGEMGPEGSLLKLVYSETLQRFTGLAARIRGAPAAIDPRNLHDTGWTSGEWLIDHIKSWTWTISAGTSEIQRNIIAERVLGLPREPVAAP